MNIIFKISNKSIRFYSTNIKLLPKQQRALIDRILRVDHAGFIH